MSTVFTDRIWLYTQPPVECLLFVLMGIVPKSCFKYLIKPGALFDVTEITPTVATGRQKQRLEQIHRVCCAIDGLKHRVDQSIVLHRSDALQ